MTRKRYLWKLTRSEVQLGGHTLVAGIVDLARASEPDRVFAQALQAEERGAGLLKLSGEDDPRVLVPVLKRLHGHIAVPVMVTTGRAGIAERAIQLGADIICDPWSLSLDPELARVASRLRAGLVLAHMRGDPEAWARQAPAPDPVARMLRDLEAAVLRARRAGVQPGQLAVDPGLGLGKRREENAVVLAQLQDLGRFNLPVMVSEPSWPKPPAPGAAPAQITASILGGAHVVAVRDVSSALAVGEEADSILSARPES